MNLGMLGEFEVATLGTLTQAGVTNAQRTTGSNLTFQVTVSGVGTNVVIRMEGSLDGVGYFPLYDASRSDTTITANGVYGFTVYAPVQFVRLRLVSVSGGTPSVVALVGVA